MLTYHIVTLTPGLKNSIGDNLAATQVADAILVFEVFRVSTKYSDCSITVTPGNGELVIVKIHKLYIPANEYDTIS